MKNMKADASNIQSLGCRGIKQATKYGPDLLSKFNNSELAQFMTGGADKKSKEHKAAMRSLQRYRKGDRTPAEDTQKTITRAVRAEVKKNPRLLDRLVGSGQVIAKGTICYSADCRKRTVPVKMSASAMGEFLRTACEDGEEGENFLFEMKDIPGMYVQSGTISIQFD